LIPLSVVGSSRPSAECPVGIGCKARRERLPLGPFGRSAGVRKLEGAPALLRALRDGRVAAAVRGTLPAAAFLSALAGAPGAKGLQRAVLLEPKRGRGVLLGPVGISEGRGARAREAFAKAACGLLRDRGLLTEAPLVAVLSVGRSEDAGRGPHIARSLAESARVVRGLQACGLDAFAAGVQIEDVLADCDVVVMPDGAAGNLAFRTLHLVGGMRSFGAPVLGLPFDVVDTSRSRSSYADPLRLAAFLAASRSAP